MVLSDITGESGIFIDGDWIESKDQNPNGDVRLIQLADIGAGDFKNKSDRHITSTTAKKLNCTFLKKGDILIARLGVPLCKACIFPLEGKYVTAVDVAIFRTDRSDISKKYLVHLLNSPWFKGQVKLYESGTTRKRISRKNLNNIEIPLPSFDEQRRIVSRIEELFSSLDNAVETLQKTKEQLAVYRQAVLKEAFAKTPTRVSLGSISESRLGKMLDKEKNIGEPRHYLRNINVRWFDFNLHDLLEMRIEDNEVEKYSLRKGDLVICEGGEPGRCAVWEKDDRIFYQKALHRVRFTDGSIPEFYMYYLWYAAQIGQLKSLFTGTGIKHLTGQSLVKVQVPKAGRTTQEFILNEIESRLSICDSIEQTVNTALAQAEAMRQSILKEAFEGRL